MSAILKYVKKLNLTFADPAKEKEFMTIQKQNLPTDFSVTILLVTLTLITVVIQKIVEEKWGEVIISGTSLAVFIIFYIAGKLSSKYIEYFILLVVLAYNVYRLVLTSYNWQITSKVNMWTGGYNYAVLQMLFISRIPNVYFRVLVVILGYIGRFTVFVVFVSPDALQAGLLVRAAMIDLFILYFFQSSEKIDRKVFKDFDEKREELLKFKELLDDSLPQPVTIVDTDTLSPLFSNVAFLQLHKESMYYEEFGPSKFIAINNEKSVCYLNLLDADSNTIREIGATQPTMPGAAFDSKKKMKTLSGVIRDLVRTCALSEKAISLIATHKASDTNSKSFEVVLKRIRWDGIDAVAVILNDITYQENLVYFKMASANKDKIIATVSHELRTPLHGIIGLLHMTEQRVDEPQALEYISLCKDNASLLMSLVNSILDLQQISTGKLQLNIEKTEVRKALDDVIRLFNFQTSKKGVFLDLLIDEDIPVNIKTDENRLKQIIINLIGNAIKFTPKGGITVRVTQESRQSDFIMISVADTGIGIKEEDKEKLFKMYSRLEDGASVNKNGVGLGLTISNALAVILSNKKDENGIDVVSTYGKGTEFSFRILKDLTNKASPEDVNGNEITKGVKELEEQMVIKENLTDETSSAVDLVDLNDKMGNYQFYKKPSLADLPSQTDRDRGFLSRKGTPSMKTSEFSKNALQLRTEESDRCLLKPPKLTPENSTLNSQSYIVIVDDNSFNLLIAQNLIRETGYQVKISMGGYEAIEVVKNLAQEDQPIKAILMDCQMPIIDGYETTKILVQMMRDKEIPVIPVIALTANNSEDDIKRCYDCGMSGHLTKPSSKNALIQCLSGLG